MNQQIVNIPVDKLHFDPLNPRIPTSVVDGNNEKQVINWMLIDASIIELMGSIGEKGFFYAEPLLVVEIPDQPGNYHVVEGNRRLSAVKLLLQPDLAVKRTKSVAVVASEAKVTPTTLPAFVYEERSKILDYLGFKHITGVKSWGALAKARYLDSLRTEFGELPINDQYKALAKAIGSRSDYVQQLLNGLGLFRVIKEHDYFDIDGLDENSIEFGVYYNALRWTNIRSFLEIEINDDKPMESINLDHLKKVVHWVSKKNSEHKTRLGESRNLNKLNKILGSEKATLSFDSGTTLSQAYMLTDEPNKVFSQAIEKSLSQLQIANGYTHLITQWEEIDITNLKDLKSISTNLRAILVAKEIEEED